MAIEKKGMMFVLSSPSGTGKTTLTKKLAENDKKFAISISHTTRKPRPNEINGKDYHFVSEEKFKNLIEENNFYEHANIFDNYYGTLKNTVNELLSKGKIVLFDIDWQGTQQLAEQSGNDLVRVFILPPSTSELQRRLLSRARDPQTVVAARMAKAMDEISHYPEYDYIIVNQRLDESVAKVQSILTSERLRRTRQIGLTSFVRNLRDWQ